MSSDFAIKVENLSKCYPVYEKSHDRLKQFVLPRIQRAMGLSSKQYFQEFWALKDVSFEVKKGETVGIIGRNGSGKSTLLQMICGTLNPTFGNIKTNGRIAALLELGSGFNPEFTGRENVYLNGALLGLSKSEVDERFNAIESFAGIGNFIDQPVKTYSSGMYVRLAFSIQANVDPEILIVDEALAVGDAYFLHKCMDRVHQLQEYGTSILLVTHDSTAVKRFCDRAYWINDGKLKLQGDASTVVDEYLVDLFKIPVVEFSENNKNDSTTSSAILSTGENYIPNIDRRLGDQRVKIAGVRLYDSTMQPISMIQNDSEVVLRYTVENIDLIEGEKLIFGYTLRNFRGDDIASNSTEIQGIVVDGFVKLGQLITVSARIKFPCFYPGNYAFSVGVSYVNNQGIMTADRIINAISIELLTNKKANTMLTLETIFEIDPK